MNKNDSFQISKFISDSMVQLVKIIFSDKNIKFDYLITKGGITSSDIATNALKIKRALVLGQIHSGIPVLKIKSPEKLSGLPLIIFPGKIGDRETLFKVNKKLR